MNKNFCGALEQKKRKTNRQKIDLEKSDILTFRVGGGTQF